VVEREARYHRIGALHRSCAPEGRQIAYLWHPSGTQLNTTPAYRWYRAIALNHRLPSTHASGVHLVSCTRGGGTGRARPHRHLRVDLRRGGSSEAPPALKAITRAAGCCAITLRGCVAGMSKIDQYPPRGPKMKTR
jgi:hypothetical protein